MARKAAAMPQLVCMNCRRLRPSRFPLTSASSRIRCSTRFCVMLCGGGRYSPFDTIWVGIGVAAEAASAPATRRCSRSLSQLLIVVLPGSVCDQRSLDLSIAPNNVLYQDRSPASACAHQISPQALNQTAAGTLGAALTVGGRARDHVAAKQQTLGPLPRHA